MCTCSRATACLAVRIYRERAYAPTCPSIYIYICIYICFSCVRTCSRATACLAVRICLSDEPARINSSHRRPASTQPCMPYTWFGTGTVESTEGRSDLVSRTISALWISRI